MACTATTHSKYGLRRKYDHAFYELPIDPNWGVPVTNCWMFLDTTTKYLRPFSSTNDVADVIASPIKGVVQDFIRPGEQRIVTVWTCGVYEFEIASATAVTAGVTKFKPYVDGGAVSNTKFTTTSTASEVLLTAIQHGPCLCQNNYPDPCTTAGAVADDSPTTALTIATTTSAVGKFCIA